MPSLRLRPDNGGKYELDYRDIDGKRYRVDTQTRDSKIAKMWLKKVEELISMAKLGVIPKVGRITREVVAGQAAPEERKRLRVEAFYQEYQDRSIHDLELSAKTQEMSRYAFQSFQSVIGNPYIDTITEDDIRKWKRDLMKAGKSRTTISMYQRSLKTAFTRAVKWKLLAENPFVDVEIPSPKRDNIKSKSMKIEEVQTLLELVGQVNRKFKRYLQFLLYTACRRNEILYLKVEDIDLKQRILYVTVSKTKRRLALPINQALMNVIEEMQKNGELPEEGYIFRSESNRRGVEKTEAWHPSTVTHWFKEYINLAGLPDHYSLHSCRHTYVTYLRSQGIPQDVIQRLLGHTSTQTTNIYDHSDALFFRQYADLVNFEA